MQPAAVIALQQRRALTEPTHMRVGNNPAGTLGDSHDMTEGWHLGWIDTERNEILTGGQPGIVGIGPSAVAKARQAARTPPLPQSGPKSRGKLIDGSVDDLVDCLAADRGRPHPVDHRMAHAEADTGFRAAYDARKRLIEDLSFDARPDRSTPHVSPVIGEPERPLAPYDFGLRQSGRLIGGNNGPLGRWSIS